MEFTATVDESQFAEMLEEAATNALDSDFQDKVNDTIADYVAQNPGEIADAVGEHLDDPADSIDWYSVIQANDLVTSDELPDISDFVQSGDFDSYAQDFVRNSLASYDASGEGMCEMGTAFHRAIVATVRPIIAEAVETAMHDVVRRMGEAISATFVPNGDPELDKLLQEEAEIERRVEASGVIRDGGIVAMTPGWSVVEGPYPGAPAIDPGPRAVYKQPDGTVQDVRRFDTVSAAEAFCRQENGMTDG